MNYREKNSWKDRQKQRTRRWIRALFACWFKVELRGNYQPESNSVIIANRTSKIDLLLLAIFLPERLTVALSLHATGKLWVKTLRLFAEIIALDSTNTWAANALVKAIDDGKRCVLFPQAIGLQEEHLKVFDVPIRVLKKIDISIIPVCIDGAQCSIFSISKHKHLIRLFPKIVLHVAPTQYLHDTHKPLNENSLKNRLFRLLSELNFITNFQAMSLFEALIKGITLGTKNGAQIEEVQRDPVTPKQFLARCFILGRQIKNQTQAGEQVGILLPTSIAGMISFFALHAYRRIPALLNFSLGFHHLLSTCMLAEIKTIYTAKQFIISAQLDTLIDELQHAGISVYFLEDFKESVHLGHKLSGLLKATFPSIAYQCIGDPVKPEETGVILFTSGSENAPKGVVLSHTNILANCCQLTSRVDFSARDKFFNALPIFHCFGLTTGSILPILTGIHCFFYPSPLHYKIIPALVQQTGATIMLSTDTFLTGYARAAKQHDFRSVRCIFSGAEKVKTATMHHWKDTFGVTIYEGYGATEASPVIATNCPLACIPNTVGMLLPSIESKIQPLENLAEGGRLLLRGPNIMVGYLSSEKKGLILSLEEGWHDTGDIVTLDEEGFLTLIGRAKRFVKIAGEMVSLTAVENVAASIWPELLHAAVSQQSTHKGEQIFLFSEAVHADKRCFIKKIKAQGDTELLIPYKIFSGRKIPILPSGKIDYLTIEQWDAAE